MTSPLLVLTSTSPVSQFWAQQYLTPSASAQMRQSSQNDPKVQGSPGSGVGPEFSHPTSSVQSSSQESVQSLTIAKYKIPFQGTWTWTLIQTCLGHHHVSRVTCSIPSHVSVTQDSLQSRGWEFHQNLDQHWDQPSKLRPMASETKKNYFNLLK